MATKKPKKAASISAPATTSAATAIAPRASSPRAPSPDRVALRAYELWLESGCAHGQHEEHWYRAERELRSAESR